MKQVHSFEVTPLEFLLESGSSHLWPFQKPNIYVQSFNRSTCQLQGEIYFMDNFNCKRALPHQIASAAPQAEPTSAA